MEVGKEMERGERQMMVIMVLKDEDKEKTVS